MERETMKKMKLMTLGLSALIFSIVAQAGDFDTQIEGRQAYMSILGYNVGILGAMTRGKMDYDADLAQAVAKNLSLAAQMNNGTMWPQGSDMGSNDNTVTKADLWANFADAGAYLSDLTDATQTLEMEAGKGLDSLNAAMGDVGKTCSGCHKQFRAKR
jgi:cytochrome c556